MKLLVDTISLQTPKGRLLFFGLISVFITTLPYSLLDKYHPSLFSYAHIPSPSIGLTRAYWQVLHGNFTAAWHRNPSIYIVLVIVIGIVIVDIKDLRKTKFIS